MGLQDEARVGAPSCYPRKSFGKSQPEGQAALIGEGSGPTGYEQNRVAPKEKKTQKTDGADCREMKGDVAING